MSWTDANDDPSDTWTGVADPSWRHLYGNERNKTTRIRLGDHVRIGGAIRTDATDPSSTWTDADDPA